MSRRRVGKQAAADALRAAADAIRKQETPTPMGEPHRLSRTPVAGILALITSLDNDEFDLLFGTLDAAMWDEWDCALHTGIEMFGVDELRIVTRTATIMAQHAEENPSAT